MRYKSKVQARFPKARLTVIRYHDDLTTPRYQSVVSITQTWDTVVLDVHCPDTTWQQGATAAWRSAYYWCVRNPAHTLPNVD